MWRWIVSQWNDIKGNVKYSILVALWWIVTWVGKILLQRIPHLSSWMVWAILLCLSLVVFVWLAKSSKVSLGVQASAMQPSQRRSTSFPSLSALNAQTPSVTFNSYEHFRRAYYSPLTAEIEENIKIAAEQNQPGDHEGFYARFIGVGLVSYLHDMTWAYIFKSQLLLLMELNRNNLPLAQAKTYYDRGVADYPGIYVKYSFQEWIEYMTREQLLIRHPSDMLEITHRGKDLLRYLAHWGRDVNVKAG